jgi:mannonate dehydratase
MSVPIHPGANPGRYGAVQKEHRGGYTMHAFELEVMRRRLAEEAPEAPISAEEHWHRSVELYRRIVPVAEDSGVRLALHPSDPPLPKALVSPRRWAGLLDEVPSDHSGLLHCIGTRYEAGIDVLRDIQHFGRKGKIFHVHFRNVRGTIPSTGGYEEVALDDGDMNMFQVLRALKEVGYDGGLQLDHMPSYSGDRPDRAMAWAYAVGYARALLAALSGS